jgi:hypothetical protein
MDKPERAMRFLRTTPVHYPIALDFSGEVGRLYGVHTMPSVVVVDADGTIAYRGYDLPTEHQNLLHSAVH